MLHRTRKVCVLNTEKPNSKARRRRALITLIGKASRYLFGSLDEDDEIELKGLIEKNKKHDGEVAKLLANQTEIILTEFGETHKKAAKLENINNILADRSKN